MMGDLFSTSLGARLRRARQILYPGDTQAAFADRLGVGLETLIRMEQGDLTVQFGTYLASARLLGCEEPLNELFGLSTTLEPMQLPRQRVVGP